MTPGARVRVTDPHSARFGCLGEVVRFEPEHPSAVDGHPVRALTYVRLVGSIWTLPYWPEHLEVVE